MEKEARAGRKESRYVNFQDDEDEEAKDSFLRRVLSSANTPGAIEALAHLEAEERQTVANMVRAQEAAERQRQARAAELNRVGVFGKNVNAVRAGSMYRVELRRQMQPVALRQKPVEVEQTPLSLETSLQALIDDLDVASGVTKPAVSPQRREQRKQRARSIYQQMGDIMGRSEPSAQAEKRKKAAGVPKESRWDAQAASAVERYRSAVQQRREQLIRDSGVTMSGAELLADDADVDYDAITQRSVEEREEEDGEGVEEARAAAVAAAAGDVGGSHRKPDPQATTALVDTALSRVQRVMQRIEMEQATSSPRKSPTRSGGGDGEQSEASDSDSDSDDHHERSRSRTKQLTAVMGEVRAAQDSTRAAAAGTGISFASASTGLTAASESASSRPAPLHVADPLVRDEAATATPAAASTSAAKGTAQPGAAAAAATTTTTTTTTRKARKTVFQQAAEPTFWGMAPALPELVMDEAMSLAERLQRRLERVWGMLRLPVMQKLDMVIKYTSPEMAPRLEAALAVWELAAASVMEREQSLTILEELHAYRTQGKDLPGLDQEVANALTALEVATVYALKADAQLQEDFEDTLTLQGVPYMENNTEPGWWHGGLPLPAEWEGEE